MGTNMILPKPMHKEEIITWLQRLDALRLENVLLKNRVAEITRHDIDFTVLERMEYFMNNFVQKDTVFDLLKHDIIKLQKQEKDTYTAETQRKQEKLRGDILRIEADFHRLKNDFYTYITTALIP
jgi:hypothetical protein